MVLHKNNSFIALSFIIAFTILSGLYLSSSYSFATSASTTASVKVAASCTLTTSGGGNYSATVPNGTSAEISGSTLSVSCNDAGGFALYAVGFSDSTVGNNSMIGASTNISTNTSGSNSYWAMKVNPVSGNTPTIDNSFNNYHVIPDTHTKVASYNQSTSGSVAVTSTYKVNISSSQLAGNYLGKVKYILVHPANEIPQQEIACDPGKVCYNANTNIVEGQMGKQTPSSTDIANGVTLWASNFKRDGYGFAGWSDKYDYKTNSDAHFYGPNQTITTPSNFSTEGLSLYAIWIESEGSLQDIERIDSLCGYPGSLSIAHTDGTTDLSSVTALTDDRDGNTYAIARLADNRCWMIENLRLDDSVALSSNNTNYPSLPLTNNYDLNTISNHLSATSSVEYNATTAPEGWCMINTSACIDQSRLRTDNTTQFVNNTTSNYSPAGNIYSFGNYYNWYSATAGHGKYGNDYGSGYTAPGDICPVGWHLPEGGTYSDFNTLDTIINDGETEGSEATNRFRAYPNNYIYSGTASLGEINERNESGQYWSATADYSNRALPFMLYEDFIYTGIYGFGKWDGRTVRCIAYLAV